MPVNRPLITMNKKSPAICAGLIVLCYLFCATSVVQGIETNGMRAPKSVLVTSSAATLSDTQASALNSFLLGSIRFFQQWISPIDGPRCSFSPTCSRFGYEAVNEHGPFLGSIMTTDRLMRCSYWTEPGLDYIRLPNGALHDPVTHNSRANYE